VELQPDGRVFQAEALLFQEAFAKSGDFANRAVSTSDRNKIFEMTEVISKQALTL
jgi:hypothetical protein